MKANLQIVRGAPAPIDLDRLARMQPHELRQLHRKIFGCESHSGNSEQARRKIARHIQSDREGGLPESARQRALAIAQEASLRIHVRHDNATSLSHATVSGVPSDRDSP